MFMLVGMDWTQCLLRWRWKLQEQTYCKNGYKRLDYRLILVAAPQEGLGWRSYLSHILFLNLPGSYLTVVEYITPSVAESQCRNWEWKIKRLCWIWQFTNSRSQNFGAIWGGVVLQTFLSIRSCLSVSQLTVSFLQGFVQTLDDRICFTYFG